jgi:hypothetical protein
LVGLLLLLRFVGEIQCNTALDRLTSDEIYTEIASGFTLRILGHRARAVKASFPAKNKCPRPFGLWAFGEVFVLY